MTGQVTVQVLKINDPPRIMLRENLLFEGRFPPSLYPRGETADRQ